jgi:Domain of unknown function (DUF4194)
MEESIIPASSDAESDLSSLVITLLKRVIYREQSERPWAALQRLQSRVRDYVDVLGLELILDESEGYAFLKSKAVTDEGADTAPLRLISRRPLSFPVSLLLALLRKKLAEFDSIGGDTRLVMTRDQLVEIMRIFLAESSNEVKLVDQIDSYITKVVDMGFLRKLKTSGTQNSYEVLRILKAFVDAQWLSELDGHLDAYKRQLQRGANDADESR